METFSLTCIIGFIDTIIKRFPLILTTLLSEWNHSAQTNKIQGELFPT